ncbi:hypothetical protein [Bradyrhizobium sp. Gha]|uniref:hypothetical protein n=1 Tax=Bradyrhizobium sp. Gha TaxID=1855318 RepID=UPI001FCD28AF|nr:hypothetical protein [Bradyrhizobium sp. Gha]
MWRAIIAGVVHLQAEPFEILADPRTDARGILADAAAQHDRIEAAEDRDRRSRPGLAAFYEVRFKASELR